MSTERVKRAALHQVYLLILQMENPSPTVAYLQWKVFWYLHNT